jgi:hypothetical protein
MLANSGEAKRLADSQEEPSSMDITSRITEHVDIEVTL